MKSNIQTGSLTFTKRKRKGGCSESKALLEPFPPQLLLFASQSGATGANRAALISKQTQAFSETQFRGRLKPCQQRG